MFLCCMSPRRCLNLCTIAAQLGDRLTDVALSDHVEFHSGTTALWRKLAKADIITEVFGIRMQPVGNYAQRHCEGLC